MSSCAATEKVFHVMPDGEIIGLYSDELQKLGDVKAERASNVEMDEFGKWEVRLSNSPLNGEYAGKVIGVFTRRDEALAYERKWLNKHVLGVLANA